MNIVFLRRRNLGKLTASILRKKSLFNITEVKNWQGDYRNWPKADILIRWGCVSAYPQNRGCKVINKASSINRASNKILTRAMLSGEVPIPETKFKLTKDLFPGKWIIRPSYHNKRRFFNIAENYELAKAICDSLGEYYLSEFIPIEQEIRVGIANGMVFYLTDKTGESKDIPFGEWPYYKEPIEMASKASEIIKIDICGVDLALSNGKWYLLEINSAPSNLSPVRKENFIKVIDFNISTISLFEEKPKKEGLIHPAIL